jgi:hypothetical protein
MMEPDFILAVGNRGCCLLIRKLSDIAIECDDNGDLFDFVNCSDSSQSQGLYFARITYTDNNEFDYEIIRSLTDYDYEYYFR